MTRSSPLIGIVGGAVLVTAVAALAIRGTGDDVDMPPDPSAQETTEPTEDATDPDLDPDATDPDADPDATDPDIDPDATDPDVDPDATDPDADPDATDPDADTDTTEEDELPVTGGGGLAVLGTLVAAGAAAAAGRRTHRA